VDFDPAAWRQGKDTQLEKAVQVAMEQLKKNPPLKPKRPAYPNYNNGAGPVATGKGANDKPAGKAASKALKASSQR